MRQLAGTKTTYRMAYATPLTDSSCPHRVHRSLRRPDELVFSLEAFDQQRGKVIPKKLTTRTSSKYGFPTPKEEQLLVGLL